jgi:thiamine-monophosphate kinase
VLPERQFIDRLRRLAGKGKNPQIICGMGDDCAILEPPAGQQLLITTDLCIEDVHFRRTWHSAESVGHRCLVRGLSDVAAMGGEPVACFLSLGVPAKLPQKWINDFLSGLLQLARLFRVTLAGGDTSSAGKISADIVLVGTVPAGKALLRAGARPGDLVYVTGQLGEAASVLKRLLRGEKIRTSRNSGHFFPLPRIETGRRLREENLASAMIDISDGLSVDLAHVCQQSGVSALIDAGTIPRAKSATLESALHGGEDYELLFTAQAHTRIPTSIAGVPITRIGEILPKSGKRRVRIRDEAGRTKQLVPRGWQHFSKI